MTLEHHVAISFKALEKPILFNVYRVGYNSTCRSIRGIINTQTSTTAQSDNDPFA